MTNEQREKITDFLRHPNHMQDAQVYSIGSMIGDGDLRLIAAMHGYELRRKGRKQEHKAIYDGNGEQLRNCYIPHITCTASVRARSIKLLEEARVQLKDYFRLECVEWCDVYEMLLLMAEHVIRNMRFHLNGVELYSSLFYLIDKKDYIRNRKNKGEKHD